MSSALSIRSLGPDAAIDSRPLDATFASRTVSIVDDDAAFAASLAALINVVPGLMVTGTATTVQEAVEVLAAADVDLALIDVCMPDGGGMAVVRAVEAMGGGPTMVLMSTESRPADAPAHLHFTNKADLDVEALAAWCAEAP